MRKPKLVSRVIRNCVCCEKTFCLDVRKIHERSRMSPFSCPYILIKPFRVINNIREWRENKWYGRRHRQIIKIDRYFWYEHYHSLILYRFICVLILYKFIRKTYYIKLLCCTINIREKYGKEYMSIYILIKSYCKNFGW